MVGKQQAAKARMMAMCAILNLRSARSRTRYTILSRAPSTRSFVLCCEGWVRKGLYVLICETSSGNKIFWVSTSTSTL